MARNSVICRRWFYASRRKSKRTAFFVKLASIFIILGLLVVYSENRIKPYLDEISESRVRDIVSSTVNSVIQDGFGEDTGYEDLVLIERDGEGKITSIQTDVAKMNRLAAGVSLDIRKRLTALRRDYIQIPAGVLTGTALFAGTGPDLNIRVKPYGNVQTVFKSEFTSLGESKTKHSIYLVTKTTVLVAVPLLNTKYELTTSVPVAESVLMGEFVDGAVG